MSRELQPFLRDYVSAIHEGHAALFVGAGLSQPAGYVNWQELLRGCADELRVDVEREHDLVALAQYFVNRGPNGRTRLKQILKDHFDRSGKVTENHRLIATLPIATVWTTNFDCLLEDAFRGAGLTVDVKRCHGDMAMSLKGRDVILYKMHGDITDLGSAVLCKDDYECYGNTHHLFQNALETDLVGKTFLFLGFSFTDPNLGYMLGHIRSILKGGSREHFAVMRRVTADVTLKPDDLLNEQARQEHMIQDLKRYNITAILIDDFSEVERLLRALHVGYRQRSVFVSGSADQAGTFGEGRLRDLCMGLGQRLMKEEFKLISGLGLNVGSDVVNGALVELYNLGHPRLDQHVGLHPFPRNLPEDLDEKQFNRDYREDMINRCGFAIFISGRSRNHEESVGVMEEYRIALDHGKICIPIGATGFAARAIWNELKPQIQTHYHHQVTEALFEKLNNAALSNEQILDGLFAVLRQVSEFDSRMTARGKEAPYPAHGRQAERRVANDRWIPHRRERVQRA